MQEMNKQTTCSLCSRIGLSLGVTFFLLFLSELGLRAMYYQRNSGYRCAIVHAFIKLKDHFSATTQNYLYSKPLYRPDSLLGYGCNPGRHELGIQMRTRLGLTSRTWKFTAVLDGQGYRITKIAANTGGDKTGIWIYGCSYTWGWPLDNEETFPFLVQNELPEYAVQNFAGNGYGTVHALLQLRHELGRGTVPPVAAIVVYNRFHLPRNVAAPSRLNEYRFVSSTMKLSGSHPKAELNGAGILSVKLVPLAPSSESNPSIEYMETVTIAIMDEIKALCDKYLILPVLAVQSDPSFDRVAVHCAEAGYKVIDMAMPYPLPPEYQIQPFDNHPNQAAHKQYAAKLLKGLGPLLVSRKLRNSSQTTP